MLGHIRSFPEDVTFFVTLWRHTCYTCYSDLKLVTDIGVIHINIILQLFARYQAKKYRFTHGSIFSHFFHIGSKKIQHPVVTLVTARNFPNLVGVLLGSILIDSDHFGTYPIISRECYIFVTLWRHTCYTCYSDLNLGTGVGVTHIHHISNIIQSLFVRYEEKKAVFTWWFHFLHNSSDGYT